MVTLIAACGTARSWSASPWRRSKAATSPRSGSCGGRTSTSGSPRTAGRPPTSPPTTPAARSASSSGREERDPGLPGRRRRHLGRRQLRVPDPRRPQLARARRSPHDRSHPRRRRTVVRLGSQARRRQRPAPTLRAIARVRASDRTLIENVSLWDPTSAICYAALGTNANKEAGVSYSIGGGSRFPSHVVGILTGTRREAVTFMGTRGPTDDKWGDYLTVSACTRTRSCSPPPPIPCRAATARATPRRTSTSSIAPATCERKPESARPSRRRWLPRRCR